MLVRPDAPIAAIDRAAFAAPVWSGELIVASTHSQHAAGRWAYVTTCNVGSDESRSARVSLADLGEDRPQTHEVAVFDWRTGRVEVIPGDGGFEVTLARAEWDFRVVAPVLASGIAVLGDPTLYACAGDTRVARVADERDQVVVTLLGAGERVHVRGWARRPVAARSWSPAAGAAEVEVTNVADTGEWDVEVSIPAAGWAKLFVRVA